MANVDAPHGFRIWGECLRVGEYAVPTAPTINIAVGDMVIEDVGNLTSGKLGSGISVYDAAVLPATTGDDRLVLGVVVACYSEKMDPIQYIAAGRVGDGTTAGYVAVADHPFQQFEAQADAALTVANLELNYEVTSATLSAPDTNTGLSTQEINVSGANVTSTIPIRLVRMAFPDQDVYSSTGCRMVCQINPLCHRYGAGTTI